MTKNILSLDDFKSKKSAVVEKTENVKNTEQLNEMVDAIDDFYRVSDDFEVPKSLISSFIKKVKESTGKDLKTSMAEMRLAEILVKWLFNNYLNIENLPVDIVTGTDKAPVQAQAQIQEEPLEPQAQAQVQAQPQAQAQVQSQAQAQVQSQPQAQAQTAAAQIPAQEI